MYILPNVVLYPKDTQKWKQFTTRQLMEYGRKWLCCIPKILKNESNSQLWRQNENRCFGCVVSQRYSKMKAIHNYDLDAKNLIIVVLYPKDTQKWKQFTTLNLLTFIFNALCCIPKILKNESNSQQNRKGCHVSDCCVVSQRYSKMKAIHNIKMKLRILTHVVLYPKDTQKWKQFTTSSKNKYCYPSNQIITGKWSLHPPIYLDPE